ncbi:MAG: DivIVA domain-containing protein [Mogibacterium sp.]|nr:DivIVA domain-containing protein [Mogibacterium sp.]
MILPLDIEKKEFTRDKRGYNSREVDEFLDLISVDYEKLLSDNRNMAHKIKFLEKQLEESQKSDTAMLETLETAKRLMGDISASAERRAELMMRDAELEAENMMLEARTNIRRLNEEHLLLTNKVLKLRKNLKAMLESELAALADDDADLLSALDRSDIPEIEKEFTAIAPKKEDITARDTLVVKDEVETAADPQQATVADLAESLKTLAEDKGRIDDTIILK